LTVFRTITSPGMALFETQLLLATRRHSIRWLRMF
jgi:hypothetical protein